MHSVQTDYKNKYKLFYNETQTSYSLSLSAGSLSIRTLPALPLSALSLFLPAPIITIAFAAPVHLIGFCFFFQFFGLAGLRFSPSTVTQGWSFTTGICSPISFGYPLNKAILPIHKKRWLFRRVRHARYDRCGAHKFPIYWAVHS